MNSNPRPPPPAAMSFTGDGRLKDTPANRALAPTAIPQHIFERSAQVPGVVYADDRSVVVLGDARTSLRHLVDAGLKVDCIVTSPPYFGQRDYGSDDQIGMESHPGEYLEELMEVFGLCKTLLRDTGSLWINIGDTYWSGKGAHGDTDPKQPARRFNRPQDKPGDGLWARPKQQLLIPHRLGVALQDSGWLVRNDNGVVLDPFNGSGTTMVFARRHGFRSVGVDVNSGYCDTAAAAMRELYAAPQLEIG